MPLTNATHNPLTTVVVRFTEYLPEYPATHPYGLTYVINTQGMTRDKVYGLMKNVSVCNLAINRLLTTYP